MPWVEVLLFLPVAVYAALVARFPGRFRHAAFVSAEAKQIPVSLVIPFRNEAGSLPALIKSLNLQNWLAGDELIFVDDRSTDGGVSLLSDLRVPAQVKVLNSPGRGKKEALVAGRSLASQEVIMGLDADVELPPDFLDHWRKRFHRGRAWAGPVLHPVGKGFFQAFAGLDFLSLVGSGLALGMGGKGAMANGANFHLSRKTWVATGEEALNGRQASGDDVFLLHRLVHQFPGEVLFCPEPELAVTTPAPPGWKGWWDQRRRWGGKTPAYTSSFTKALALLVFAANLSLIILPFIAWPWGLVAWMLKGGTEMRFLWKLCVWFDRNEWKPYLPAATVIYPLVLCAVVVSLPFGGKKWKV